MLIGFAAQMVDGALGMAYGLTASSFLLATGLPPVQVSATVHLAEAFTTGASAISHHKFGNVDGDLFRRLILPGCLGACIGAYLLSSLPGEKLKPWVAGYIMIMGAIVFAKAFTQIPPVRVAGRVSSLGFFGALVDAMGGGGWGPIVTSTLLARGNEARFTVGTVNAVEFFVTLSSSAVFLVTVGLGLWKIVLPLALGGFFAAPLAAYVCKLVPHRIMLAVVGLVIIGVSFRTLFKVLSG
ncbi:MAG: sulfite exporter TauE/SafE family protein [Limisphaera sp.]|nr:sulfite exporter TauE/SafE family protein [Limisphaera sp.]